MSKQIAIHYVGGIRPDAPFNLAYVPKPQLDVVTRWMEQLPDNRKEIIDRAESPLSSKNKTEALLLKQAFGELRAQIHD